VVRCAFWQVFKIDDQPCIAAHKSLITTQKSAKSP
jgi:hypothetical protein